MAVINSSADAAVWAFMMLSLPCCPAVHAAVHVHVVVQGIATAFLGLQSTDGAAVGHSMLFLNVRFVYCSLQERLDKRAGRRRLTGSGKVKEAHSSWPYVYLQFNKRSTSALQPFDFCPTGVRLLPCSRSMAIAMASNRHMA